MKAVICQGRKQQQHTKPEKQHPEAQHLCFCDSGFWRQTLSLIVYRYHCEQSLPVESDDIEKQT